MDILRIGKLLVAIAFAAGLPGAGRGAGVLSPSADGIGQHGPAASAGDPLRSAAPRRDAEIQCLAQAIAYEAANEPEAGRRAVAAVVINRLHHRAFPKTVCGVVFQGAARRTGCQFTFTCDGALRRTLSRRIWADSRRIAEQAIDGNLAAQIGAATHYHADYVSPRWAPAMVRIGQIGAHVFYHFPHRGDAIETPARGDAVETGGRQSTGGRTPPSQPDRQARRYRFTAWGLPAETKGID